MPLGAGVLGAAATGERTFMTTDYSSDGTIVHLDRIDAAVREEGVRAILAAPLKIEGQVIGALLVADRASRQYLPEEQLIIESLAPLAAVAVENARRFEEQHEALEREREARAEASANLDRVRRLAAAEQSFGDALSSGSGVDALLRELHDCLDAHAVAFDAQGRIVSSTLPSKPEQKIESAIRGALRSGKAASPARAEKSGLELVLARAHGSVLGGIIAIRPALRRNAPTDHETDSIILNRASGHLATLMLFQRTLDESRYRQERDLMSALAAFEPGDDPRPLERSLLKLSTGAEIPAENRSMLVIELGQDHHLHALRALRSSGAVSVAASHEGHVCGLFDSGAVPPGGIAQALHGLAPDFYGAVSSCRLLANSAQAHAEAQSLARALAQLGRPREIVDRGLLGTAGLLLGGGGERIVNEIIAEQLGPLLDYDDRHDTALTDTCEAWFECGRSIPDTAQRLFVHPNTVRQRLERVAVLLGPAWADGSRSLDLHLALRLWRFAAGKRSD